MGRALLLFAPIAAAAVFLSFFPSYSFWSLGNGAELGPVLRAVWIILGVFFIGWVQDYGAMIMGVRREGDTMGALSYKLISPRARTILMIFIW